MTNEIEEQEKVEEQENESSDSKTENISTNANTNVEETFQPEILKKPKRKFIKWIVLSSTLILLAAIAITAVWYVDTYVKSDILFVANCDQTVDKLRDLPGKNSGELPTLSRTEYKFEGWYTDENLSQEVTTLEFGSEDITLFAKWGSYGDGTEASPLEIHNLSQFKQINDFTKSYYILKSDITLDADWSTIANFCGSFDGNNFKIIFSESNKNTCLFGDISILATVKNLTISGTIVNEFDKENNYGILTNINNGTITNCTLDCSVSYKVTSEKEKSEEDFYLGGLAGKNFGKITNSTVNGTVNITNESSIGTFYAGVTGFNLGTVSDCTNSSSITGVVCDLGGIVGWNEENISNCTNKGSISVSGAVAGYQNVAAGIASSNQDGTIEGCTNNGEITSTASTPKEKTEYCEELISSACAGGITGNNKGIIKNCINDAKITSVSLSSYATSGGICGDSNGEISDCTNSGKCASASSNVEFRSNCGGITGGLYISGVIERCSNSGEITYAENDMYSYNYLGGICGFSEGSISESYNTGRVISYSTLLKTSSFAGGIVGYNYKEAAINSCYNTGTVIAKSKKYSAFAGGITAANDGTVSNTYAKCTVNIKSMNMQYYSFAGGIAAGNSGTISSSYYIGEISRGDSLSYAGGIICFNEEDGSISNCHWYSDSEIVEYGNANNESNKDSTKYKNENDMYELADTLGTKNWKNTDNGTPKLIWEK